MVIQLLHVPPKERAKDGLAWTKTKKPNAVASFLFMHSSHGVSNGKTTTDTAAGRKRRSQKRARFAWAGWRRSAA
ncbi:MAG: hypothetical protein AAGC56_00025 [Pseudomonadota bacterium]